METKFFQVRNKRDSTYSAVMKLCQDCTLHERLPRLGDYESLSEFSLAATGDSTMML